MSASSNEGYNTKLRREAIKRLVAQQNIGTQTELTEKLELEGFRTTQSTISRDIRELHLVKVSSKNGKFYTVPDTREETLTNDQFAMMLRNVSPRIDRAMNLVVLHTAPGMAQALCAIMDKMPWEGIVGTLAGDDTILLIGSDEASAKKLVENLSAL